MTHLSSEAVRLEFERYFLESRKSKGANRKPTFERFEDGTYKDDHTQRHWWTWQNALRRIPELEAERDQLREALSATQPARAAQGAGEVVADLKRLASVCPELNLNNYGPDDVDELNAWAIEVAQAIDQLADTAQPVPVVPEALRKWHEAYGRYLHWNGEYNRKHALAEELNVPFPGPDLNTEFQAFTSAKNEAYRLQGPLHDAITAMLAATPTPPAQAAQQGGEA